MFLVSDKIVAGMALLRMLSGLIELTAALLMLKLGRVESAFKINAALAMIGPTIMILVTTLGLVGLSGKISYQRMAVIFLGVVFIFAGMRKN
ncbi:MAG: YqhV family protein [Clostridia bacterium]|nr:YqhV family protein [Clostridia bacterium]